MGAGIVGQPHIIIRIMTLKNVEDFRQTKKVYFYYYIPFLVLATMAGLCCRAILSDTSAFDPELALPSLATMQLHEVFVGLVLAGVFSSTISTADSQVLTCSASVTEDMGLFKEKHAYLINKIVTLIVTAIVLLLALKASRSVFSLVILAWSALAASLGPMIILSSYKKNYSQAQAIATMIGGLLASSSFRMAGFHTIINETLIGFLAGFVIFFIWPKKNSR